MLRAEVKRPDEARTLRDVVPGSVVSLDLVSRPYYLVLNDSTRDMVPVVAVGTSGDNGSPDGYTELAWGGLMYIEARTRVLENYGMLTIDIKDKIEGSEP